MRCDQCKHWKSVEDWEFDHVNMRKCLAIRQAWDVKDSPFEQPNSLQKSDYDDWEEVERIEKDALIAAKAVAQDGSSYSAAIYTREDFGCVLFEQKP